MYKNEKTYFPPFPLSLSLSLSFSLFWVREWEGQGKVTFSVCVEEWRKSEGFECFVVKELKKDL